MKIYLDREGNTLTVWFGDPQDEFTCEETAEEVVLIKDRAARVIGFEKLNFSQTPGEGLSVAFEAVSS